MKKILLIGGGGYIGTVLADSLLKENYQVRILDLFIYQNFFSIKKLIPNHNFEFIRGDYCNKEMLNSSLKEIDDVIILGGLVGDPISKKYPVESDLINNIGIKHCIDKITKLNLNKLIFISTCSNYGLIANNEKADENFPLNPLSHYAKSKVENEKYLMSFKNKTNVSPTILRFATAFGSSNRMRFDLTVNQFTIELLNKQNLLVYDADTWRPYCHVLDFARLVIKVLKANKDITDFEVFNGGDNSNNHTKQDIVDKILRFIPTGKIKYKKSGPDKRNYLVNFKKVKEKLGFETKYKVDHGIEEIIIKFNEGFYNNYLDNFEKYGNYSINYKK